MCISHLDAAGKAVARAAHGWMAGAPMARGWRGRCGDPTRPERDLDGAVRDMPVRLRCVARSGDARRTRVAARTSRDRRLGIPPARQHAVEQVGVDLWKRITP